MESNIEAIFPVLSFDLRGSPDRRRLFIREKAIPKSDESFSSEGDKLVKNILLMVLSICVCSSTAFAQDNPKPQDPQLGTQVEALEKRLLRSEAELKRLREEVRQDRKRTDAKLDSAIESQSGIKTSADAAIEKLGEKVNSAEKGIVEKFSAVKADITNELGSSYMRPIFILGGIAVLTIFGLVFLRYKSKKDVDQVIALVDSTRKDLQAETVKLDERLLSFLEKEVEQPGRNLAKDDHSLPLKVADEVVRIQNYLSYIDPALKGVKHLGASVKRLEDYLLTRGYEIPALLGRDYDDGMKVVANFKSDENLKPGEQKITRIIKPQVNFNGEMIQAAEIEVSLG